MGNFATRLLTQRLILALGALLVASFAIFFMIELLPGDAATRTLGRGAEPAAVEALRERLGLTRPPLVRYGAWLRDFLAGDWGHSLAADRPVTDYVLPRLGNTVVLGSLALLLYVPLALTTGVLTAVFRHRRLATLASVLLLLGTAVPEFVIAIILLLLFTVVLPWFPPLADVTTVHGVGDLVRTLALPVLTLTVAMTAYAVRMIQGSLVSVLESDYIRMATLRGFSPARVVLRHALPQALSPMVRVTVLNIAWVVGGVVIVERIFEFPGVGNLLVESIQILDTPVIAAITLILAATYIIANTAADLLAALLNPKLRG